jgi:peptidyl-prolyl cis-trans isomerase C
MKLLGKYSVVAMGLLLACVGTAQTLTSSHAPTAAKTVAAVRPAVAPGKVVARVNGVPITQAELATEMRAVFPYYSMHGNAIPKEFEDDFRKKALNNLIDTELAYQEAKRRNLQITPVEWRKRVAEIRKDYGSQAAFDADIQRLFGSRAGFEAKLRHDMLLDKIFLIEVKRKSVVTDADVLREYEADKASFVMPEHISFQSISAMFPQNATPAEKQAARKRIETVLPQAKAAKSYEQFGVLAEKVSEDEFRVMMGDHKMVHRGSLEPQFEVAFSMKPGEISGIIESPRGFHILRLNKHEAERKMPFPEVRAMLKQNMQKDRTAARNKAFHAGLRKVAKVEVL